MQLPYLESMHGRVVISCSILLLLTPPAIDLTLDGTRRFAACRCCSSSSSTRATLRQRCWRG